ncbi:biopolymer transporter ExbD [Vibrio parahaemolyticus]|nr:biopolymer transporter ExbD [Vibrio parahaemolyticus]
MKFLPFKRSTEARETDLNITPFLSLMVVLIPVLLVSVKFSLLAQYDVHTSGAQSEQVQTQDPLILPYRLRITPQDLTLFQGEASLLVVDDLTDREAVAKALSSVIEGLSDKAPLAIELEANASYQEMVGLLDVLHQYDAVFSSVSIDVKEGV